jgi:hypothetical protein
MLGEESVEVCFELLLADAVALNGLQVFLIDQDAERGGVFSNGIDAFCQ